MCEIRSLTIDTTERRIDTYATRIVSMSPHSTRNRLTHGLINVTFQRRILGISSLELLHDSRLIKVVIHDVNYRYDVTII